MGRKPRPGPGGVRLGLALASFITAVSAAQGPLGAEVAGAARRIEQRVRLRIEDPAPPVPEVQPARSHDDDTFEPWELVRV